MPLKTSPMWPVRRHPITGLRLQHLNLLPCRSVFLGGDPRLKTSWRLPDSQRGNGEVGSFAEHLREAIRQTAADPDALLVLSGAPTSGLHISESASYMRLAQALGLLDDADVLQRIALEEAGRDSLERILFGLCKFHETVGALPHLVRVFGPSLQKERIELHARTLGVRPGQFRYIAVGDPPDLAAAKAAEARTLAGFRADPWALNGDLADERRRRSPFGYKSPYEFTCHSSARLQKLLALNSGVSPDLRSKTFVPYHRRHNGAHWNVNDALASALLQKTLFEMGYRRDSDIVEQTAEVQFEDPFEQIPPERWGGSPNDYCFLRNVDLLLMTMRPPLDEDGRKIVSRTHSWLERAILRVCRRFFTNCSRKNVTIARRFAEQLPPNLRDRADLNFQVFDTRDGSEKEHVDFMAEYREPRPDTTNRKGLHNHRGCTCCYLAYSGSQNEIGCPVLVAFGQSGSDTHRIAEALADTSLGETLEELLTAAGDRDQLVMVEFWREAPDAPCKFDVILPAPQWAAAGREEPVKPLLTRSI
ncbi:MAG TPA: hypothetical protein VMS17_04465 [Gemmataceae bacterium]|nr:hypothetical protein [Gemmataceae bacterium]